MDQRKNLISYIKEKYDVEPEYPWPKYPDKMAFKEKGSGKWFALIMTVARRNLGLVGYDGLHIVNVKANPEFAAMITQVNGYMPAYHMNKQHWITIFLDGTVPLAQVFDRIDESWTLISDTPTKRIYDAVKQIPKGQVATYGQVAEMAGDKKMARAVGNALHKNPDPDGIPCYRVVNAKGELAGAFAFGGENMQASLLEQDGIEVRDGKVDLKKYGIKICF